MFDIPEELKKLPTCPGVYMHKDSLGEIIYVGKAVNLRNRVRSYFREAAKSDPKTRKLISNIAEFEYITCATEMEALVLECNLIKKHLPRYNILLKDDKTYPYIEVTLGEEYPRVIRTRRIEKDGGRYFGPYSDVNAVWQVLRLIDEMYPLKKCRAKSFPAAVRPCLNYHIGKCRGVCIGEADKAEYDEMVSDIVEILSGRDAKLISSLEQRMNDASEALNYEEAAKYRDYIKAVGLLGETQRVTMVRDRDVDILIPVMTARNSIVALYKVRDGKLVGREICYIRDDAVFAFDRNGENCREILESFIKLHYTGTRSLPREIIVPWHIDDEELIMALLNQVNADNVESRSDVMHKTRVTVPERGEKKALLKLAEADSVELAKSLDERAERERERRDALRGSLTEIIEYAARIDGHIPMIIGEDEDREYRIEAYDISNYNGLDTVGAMVVYEGRNAIRSDYRKFKVRTAEGDDYGSLREVIYRRLKRARNNDKGFNTYPDIMFIDGGLGQVHAVKAVVDAFRIAIPIIGLAKDDAHRTRAIVFDDGHEIDLKSNKLLFSYCGTIQEEVHRFAITYMSGVKGKKMIHSVLEDIPGVGPARRRALLAKYGSIQAIKSASYEDILATDGITEKVAESIVDYIKGDGGKRSE